MDVLRKEGYELDPQSAAEKAVSVIGLGYDLCKDIRWSGCKSRVMEFDMSHTKELEFPGGVVLPNVPSCIKSHQGERSRLSATLPFDEMSTLFNQKLYLSGNIPSGAFNAMFDMSSCWKKDAASTKMLAFDGWFITLYKVELDRTHTTISNSVKREVPSSWNPAALAEFIEKYGTHIVVGVEMGGKDVVHIKHLRKSNIQPAEMQKLLKQVADERFSEDLNRSSDGNTTEKLGELKNGHESHDMPWEVHIAFAASVQPYVESLIKNEGIVSISVRRGGIVGCGQHNQWISTVSQSPNVISMSFVPITSLMNSVPGIGYLNHAVNMYLKCKPPIEELHQFLEFQLRRHWAPVYDQPPRFGPKLKRNMSPALRFTFMGPKLYVKTMQVESGCRPVTGIRLFLEGRKSDHLGIHLQHLSNLPRTLQILDHHDYDCIDEPIDGAYFEPVKWRLFSHVCTAPVECSGSHIDESACIVTKAWFEVKLIKMKKVLFLRLGYSTVASSIIRRSEWDGPSSASRKSGFFSTLMSTVLSQELHPSRIETEKPPKEDKDIDSAVATMSYNNESNRDAPVPTKAPKLLRFVDTNEAVRGPSDTPGYWVVTGAKLWVEGGKISIKVKYSLLNIINGEI